MPQHKDIPPSLLLVDLENPRLPQPNTGQREAQRELAKHLQRKLLVLADDIIKWRLNPGDLPFVMALPDDDQGRYIVLEGNRRLVALRALESPDSFFGAFDGNVLKQMQTLSRDYHNNPIESVYCVVVKDRAEAAHWIELRHGGELEGAGIVKWGPDESQRFKSRNSGTISITAQALDFLEEGGHLSQDERRKVPVSSLERLLITPELRDSVGLALEKKVLKVVGDRKRVAKALLHVVHDLTDGGTNTSDIYSKKKRLEYVKNIPASVKVKRSLKTPQPLTQPQGDQPGKKKAQAPKPVVPKPRDYLIPRDCVLAVTHPRIRLIEIELRTLSLQTYVNAAAVMFRVFLELSVDEYIVTQKLPASPNDTFRNKIATVLADLLGRSKLNSQQAKPVRKAMSKGSYLLPSIDLLHDYIHCQDAFPAAGDLRAHWDSLQPFVVAIWTP